MERLHLDLGARREVTAWLTRRELLRRGAGLAGAALAVEAMRPLGLGRRSAEAAQSALGRWATKAPLPFARTEVSVAALSGKMYLIGGYAHGRVDQPFNQEYDPAADRWRDLAPMPRGLNHVGVIGANGRIFTFGGFIQQNRNAIADAFEYDAAANRWRTIRPLLAKRGAMSVVELNGRLHLVGGRDETSVSAHDVYDPATDTWAQRAPLPDGRDHLGLVVVEGRIHAIGGRFNTFANNTDLHHVYDPQADRWQTRAPLPTARSGVAAGLLGGRIFVAGGETTGKVFPENEAYNPATDRWTVMASMRTPRHGTGAAVLGSAIYMAGGGLTVGGSQPSTVNEPSASPESRTPKLPHPVQGCHDARGPIPCGHHDPVGLVRLVPGRAGLAMTVREFFTTAPFRLAAEEAPREIVFAIEGPGMRATGAFRVAGEAMGSVLSTETWVETFNSRARRYFQLYWTVIGPFSGLIRRMLLAAAKRRA